MNHSRLSHVYPAVFSALVFVVAIAGLAFEQGAQGKTTGVESREPAVARASETANVSSEVRDVVAFVDAVPSQDFAITGERGDVLKQPASVASVSSEVRGTESDSLGKSGVSDTLSAPRVLGSATLIVYGDAIRQWQEEVREGDTVESWMRRIEAHGLDVEWKSFASFGGFVYGLEGISQSSGSYWLYTVNGRSASKGVSSQEVHPSDVMEWRYE